MIVSISKGQPRWPLSFRYRKLPTLAPGDEAWNADDVEAFERAYLDQLDALGTERVLDDLERIGGGSPVVMLCWEKPHEPFCHRWLLADWLHAKTGLGVPELEHGMLPQCEGAAEPSLF